MQLSTFSTLKAKIGNDYDISDGNFCSDTELVGYFNEAIKDAQTAIHTMHHEDKYFLTSTPLNLVSGVPTIAMPTDIYGSKIRKIFYVNGSDAYQVNRILRLEDIVIVDPSMRFKYLLTNGSSGIAPVINIYPTPQITGALGTIWYVREMKTMTTSLVDATNVCEIPECENFVYAHVKKNLAKKTRRADLIANEDADLKTQYQIMLEALKEMTLEEDNLVPMDLTSYWGQEGQWW